MNFKNNIFTIILITILIFTGACKKDEDINIEDEINFNKPNGNDLIISESFIGEKNQISSIYELLEKENGNMYTNFKKNGQYCVGEINSSGNFIWQKNVNFKPKSIYEVSINETNLSNALLVVGNDEKGDFGIISLYDKNGNFISDKIFNTFNYTLFNSAKKILDIKEIINGYGELSLCNQSIDDLDMKFYMVAGGAGENNINICPLIVIFAIDNNGKIVSEFPYFDNIENFKLFEDYPQTCFNEIGLQKVPTLNCSPPDGGCNCPGVLGDDFYSENCSCSNYQILSAYTVNNNSEIVNFSICHLSATSSWSVVNYTTDNCLEISNINYSIGEIDWFTTIKQSSEIYKTSIDIGNGSLFLGCDIFIIGETETNKEEAPSSENYWKAGLVASLDYDGNINWQKNYLLSNYLDRYRSAYFEGNFIFTCGIYSSYIFPETKDIYGYGLISKISMETGNSISHKFIGNEKCYSGLNTIIGTNSSLFLGGFTNYYNTDIKQAQGWFVEYDKSGL